MAKRADALGNQVTAFHSCAGRGHQLQGVEHRPRDVPMEVVRGQVQGVGVRQQVRKAFGNAGAVFLGNTDVDARHGSGFAGVFGGCFGHWVLLDAVKSSHSDPL
jgi:hypothetical protein